MVLGFLSKPLERRLVLSVPELLCPKVPIRDLVFRNKRMRKINIKKKKDKIE